MVCVCVLMVLGMFMFVNVMSILMSVMSPPPCVYGGVVWDILCFRLCVSFVSCIVLMSGFVLCVSCFCTKILLLMPFILIFEV